MFTQGQIIFSILFIVVFAVVIFMMYGKDKNMHKTYYKGSKWVFISFFVFLGLLFLIKNFLKQ